MSLKTEIERLCKEKLSPEERNKLYPKELTKEEIDKILAEQTKGMTFRQNVRDNVRANNLRNADR